MKKALKIFAALLLIFTQSWSQTQMNNWYLSPYQMDMTVPIPLAILIAPVYGTTPAVAAGKVGNGFYDATNKLLFYVADGTVYDYNNTVIGNIPNGGAEVAIVPFGTNASIPCQRKFNIFSILGGVTSDVELWQTVLDMNSYSLAASVPIDSVPFQTEFGSLAIGKVFGTALDRYLYFMAASGTVGTAGGQINKLIIHNDGSVSPSIPLYPNPSIGVTNSNAGGEVFSKGLELSPDGKWLAWASYAQGNINGQPVQNRYHFVALNSSGDLNVATYGTVNVYQQFNINGANYNLNTAGFRGVEFDATSTKLFMGAGTDGIYSANIAIPFTSPFTPVGFSNGTTSTSFGFSQIELANNHFMYAASLAGGGGKNIGAINPSSSTPQILNLNSFAFTNPPKDVYTLVGTNPNSTLYTLPDQIDGQNYSTITPASATTVLTYNTYTFGAVSSQTATWSYTNSANPWNTPTEEIHIIKELRIKNNSNLTIDGMTFKFSPQAKVVIEQGSTLTIDGTTFTSNYNREPCVSAYTWLGVEVWGSSTVNQHASQGKLVMKGGSKIKYAQSKVQIIQTDSI